ncbi:DUF6265 family protein [Permianibacter aggregans]|uniref:DUF6265 domain-containing protein n=1 Tax=Permianibacter aggregans TaxID=1510150 RepID=A0A4R6UR99_9GAMM|nr:DUF6265 family protein [Permianibacter aggregans]QGX38406.1 hypothetical protein E2H98_01485 [Permianibacter aggregans]TDQ48736.1 hypothetical protein EV696_106177 [Permianibacter aggregans]
MRYKALTIAAMVAGLAAASSLQANQAEALDWLTGHWCGGSGDEQIEEYWLAPKGGISLGISRTLRSGKIASFEYMRIAASADAVHFIAQPGGGKPVAFKRTASGADWVRFENPEHDFPRLIEYRHDGNSLTAEIAGPGKDGKTMAIPFAYTRCESAIN